MQTLWRTVRELFIFIVLALVIVLPIRYFIAQPFDVEGASMVPTFHDNDYLIVDQLSYRFHEPKRGDVIVFRYPGNPEGRLPVYYIKRIIGLPGETVHIDRGTVTITKTDGTKITLDEPYVKNEDASYSPDKQLGPGQYYVMGDNRANSSDSRVWGALPFDHIMGTPVARLLPFSNTDFFPGRVSLPQ